MGHHPVKYGVFSQLLLLFLFVGTAASASSADGRSSAEQTSGEIGLFKSVLDVESTSEGDFGLGDPERTVLDDDDDGDGEPDESRGEPFLAPIPFRSPTMGWGGALAGGYIFRIDPDDRESPPSTVSLAGFASENKSLGGVLSGRFHVAEDLWRVSSLLVLARVNYDFFGIGNEAGDSGEKVEVEADIFMISFEALRRLPDRVRVLGEPIYLGPSLAINHTENSVGSGTLPPDVSASELDETRVGPGVHVQRDSRDDSFYPQEGSLADFEFQFFDTGLGSDFSYRVWDLAYRRYDQLWPEGVLASRMFGRFVDGDVSFSDLSQHDLRGYERGRYRDKMHVASEIEIRQHLFWRFAGTIFAGIGQVSSTIEDFSGDNLLWSSGFGLRYRLTDQNRMNYRSDIAWGRDGAEFYFSITEAF